MIATVLGIVAMLASLFFAGAACGAPRRSEVREAAGSAAGLLFLVAALLLF